MVEDLAKLAGVVARAAGNEVVLVMAPEQAVAATLRSDQLIFPVLASAALPVKTVIAVAAAGVGSAADAVPQISVGRENALIGDDVPGAGPATLSVFQTDGVAVRMTLPVTWTLRSPGTLAWIDAVTW
jgi:hypothetical protein